MNTTATQTALPATITVDFQPYGCVKLGKLHWATESERDYNNGGMRHRKVLRGTVIDGRERGYLFGATSSRDIAGQERTVYGVKDFEIERGHIVRVAG
jgi:hypothetical protein